jgi:hypothetical protein
MRFFAFNFFGKLFPSSSITLHQIFATMPRPLHHEHDRQPKIYSMQSLSTLEYYVGSTKQLFKTRINMHRCNYRAKSNTTRACKILASGEFIAQVLEYLPADSTRETMAMREHHWITQLRSEGKVVINHNVPGRSNRDWYFANRERILAYNKAKRLAIKDGLKAYDEFAQELRDLVHE